MCTHTRTHTQINSVHIQYFLMYYFTTEFVYCSCYCYLLFITTSKKTVHLYNCIVFYICISIVNYTIVTSYIAVAK